MRRLATRLAHEVRDHAVELGALVAEALLARAQRAEVLCAMSKSGATLIVIDKELSPEEHRGAQRQAGQRTGRLWQAVVDLEHDAARRLAGDADVKEHVHHGCAPGAGQCGA